MRAAGQPPQSASAGIRLLVALGALWLVSVVVVATTENPVLVPTMLMLGGFAVPLAAMTAVLDRFGRHLDTGLVLRAFLVAGTFGLVTAAGVESWLLADVSAYWVGVAVTEELVKAAVVIWVARDLVSRAPRDGMLVGMVVGAGFASFENAGYGFYAATSGGSDHLLLRTVAVEVARSVITVFGHLTWTTIVGGALFAAAASTGRWWTRHSATTLAGVAGMHASWNASAGLALVLTAGLAGHGWEWQWPASSTWPGTPDRSEMALYLAVYAALFWPIALLGFGWLRRRWRAAPV